MPSSNATTEFTISIGSAKVNLATRHCSGYDAATSTGPGHVMRLSTLSEGEAVIELNGFVGTLTIKSRNDVNMDEDAAVTENHSRVVDQSATAALHGVLGFCGQSEPLPTDALLTGNTLMVNSTTNGSLSVSSNLTQKQDSHPSHDAEHYLEHIIREFIIVLGGSVIVRDLGRYLLTCSDSQNSNRRSAHEEMKVLFVSLQKFLALRPEIFHVKTVRGNDKIVCLRIDEVGTDDASSITSSPSLSTGRCNSCINIEEVQANDIIYNDKKPCNTEPTLDNMTSSTGVTERHNISPNRFIRTNSAQAETTDGVGELMYQSRFTSHARRLHIGRIPSIVCVDELHAFFRDTIRQSIILDPSINPNAALHKVQYVDSDPVLNVQIHIDRRFNRRYGFVEFNTVEITTACLTLHGVTILGWGKVDVVRPKQYIITLAQKYNITEIPSLDFSRLLGTPDSTILDVPNKIIINNLAQQFEDCQIMKEEHVKKEEDVGLSSTVELHDSSNLTPESPLSNLGLPYDTEDEFDKGGNDFNCVVKDDTDQQDQSLYTTPTMPIRRFRSKSFATLKSKSISWASICSESDSDSEFGDYDCTVEATKNLGGIRRMEENIIIFKDDDDTFKNNVRQTSDSSASRLSLSGVGDDRVTDMTDQVHTNDATKANWVTVVSNKKKNFQRINSCPSVLDSTIRQSLSPNKYTPPHLRLKTENSD